MLLRPTRSARRSIVATIVAWAMVLGMLLPAAGTLLPHDPVSYDAKVSSIEARSELSVGDDGQTVPRSLNDHRACVCVFCRDCGPCAHPALIVPFALQAAMPAVLQQPGNDAATAGTTVAGHGKPPRA